MANFGPTNYSFELDSYDPGTNAIGAAQELPRITEFNGINEESVVTDLTALGDDIQSEGATGLASFERITVKGFVDDAAAGAFRRIGRPARRVDYPDRTFKATHRTGVEQSIEVFPVMNKLVTAADGITMFEATFAIAAKASTDLVEAGL